MLEGSSQARRLTPAAADRQRRSHESPSQAMLVSGTCRIAETAAAQLIR